MLSQGTPWKNPGGKDWNRARTATLIFDAFQSNFQTLAAQSYETTQAGSCVP